MAAKVCHLSKFLNSEKQQDLHCFIGSTAIFSAIVSNLCFLLETSIKIIKVIIQISKLKTFSILKNPSNILLKTVCFRLHHNQIVENDPVDRSGSI